MSALRIFVFHRFDQMKDSHRPELPEPPHRLNVITVLKLKGGVGKTHSAWLLPGASQERGKKLLATDAQRNPPRTPLPDIPEGPAIEALFYTRRFAGLFGFTHGSE
jgi:hypothetical protein